MPFPVGVATVTVTKDYRDAFGDHPSPISVRFTPSARKVITAQGLTIEPTTVTGTITNGVLTAVLAATDGFSYRVSERVAGKQRAPFDVLVPGPGPYKLDELAPIEPAIPQYTPVRTVEGIGPDANGNVDLPASVGSAPSSRIIATASGLQGGGDLSADRTISPVYGNSADTVCEGDDSRLSDARTPLAHSHAQADVTGLVTALSGKEATGVAAGLVVAHEAASDPHAQYLTQTEGDVRYDAAGAATTAVAGHVAAGDPHPQYLTSGEMPTGAQAKLVCREAWIKLGPATNVNLNTGSSSWGTLPGFATLSIPAVAGDRVGLAVNALRQANANLLVDFGVVVAGTIKRWLGGNYTAVSPPGSNYEGDPAFYHTNLPSVSCERRFTVAADDVDGANVVFAVLCKVNGAGSALLLCSDENPFYWEATNYGVVA